MIGITVESSSFANPAINTSSSSSSSVSRKQQSIRGGGGGGSGNTSLNHSSNSLNQSLNGTSSNTTPRGGGKIVPNIISREVNRSSSPLRNNNQTSPLRSNNSNNQQSSRTSSPIRNNKWATNRKAQPAWSDNSSLDTSETRARSISEEIITLRDDNSRLRKEMDNMKLLLSCQKEENFILSTSLFSAQEELKKLKIIIKKRENDIREQQEKMESLLSHSVDLRPTRNSNRSSSNGETQVLKKELESLRGKLKASEERFDKLKMINKATEDNVDCLLNQLEHERVTKDKLLDQAKNSLLNDQCEKEKNESFRSFLDIYQDNKQHVGEVELEDKFEQLLLAKQELETKLFKREEQLIDMTMKFESARCELIKNSIL